MRVYFEKPRTTTGWKGLINDPAPRRLQRRQHRAAARARAAARGARAGAAGRLRVPRPDHPAVHRRHRRLGRDRRAHDREPDAPPAGVRACRCRSASRTAPTATSASRSTPSAPRRAPHTFAGVDGVGRRRRSSRRGNPDGHIILRGGRGGPELRRRLASQGALSQMADAGLAERVIVDASHDNSGKDHERQPLVSKAIADQVAAGDKAIVGVMLESFLVAGAQKVTNGREGLTYGQSITDKCIDWETTVDVLDGLAAAVRARVAPPPAPAPAPPRADAPAPRADAPRHADAAALRRASPLARARPRARRGARLGAAGGGRAARRRRCSASACPRRRSPSAGSTASCRASRRRSRRRATHGFTPTLRVGGGRAAAIHGGAISFGVAAPAVARRRPPRVRFAWLAALVQGASHSSASPPSTASCRTSTAPATGACTPAASSWPASRSACAETRPGPRACCSSPAPRRRRGGAESGPRRAGLPLDPATVGAVEDARRGVTVKGDGRGAARRAGRPRPARSRRRSTPPSLAAAERLRERHALA